MVTATGRSGSTGTDSVHQDETERVHYLDMSATDGLTALAGGGQTGATSLGSFTINRVGTVATTADSVQLPKAKAGRVRLVKNAGANSMNVYPQSGEAINALTSDSAFAMASNKAALFFCAVDGTWDSILTA